MPFYKKEYLMKKYINSSKCKNLSKYFIGGFIILLLMILFMVAGVGFGNYTIIDTAINDDFDIGASDLDTALANSYTPGSTIVSNTFSKTNTTGVNYKPSIAKDRVLISIANSDYNHGGCGFGSGYLKIDTDSAYNKENSGVALFNIEITGQAQDLLQNNLMYLTFSGNLKSLGGSDGYLSLYVRLGSDEYGSTSTSVPSGWQCLIPSFSVTKDGHNRDVQNTTWKPSGSVFKDKARMFLTVACFTSTKKATLGWRDMYYQLDGFNINFKSLDTTKPVSSVNTISDWSTSQDVTFQASDNMIELSNVSSVSSTTGYKIMGSLGGINSSTKKYPYMIDNLKEGVKLSLTDTSGNVATTTYSAGTLKIDRVLPSIEAVYITKKNTLQMISLTEAYKDNVDIYVVVKDADVDTSKVVSSAKCAGFNSVSKLSMSINGSADSYFTPNNLNLSSFTFTQTSGAPLTVTQTTTSSYTSSNTTRSRAVYKISNQSANGVYSFYITDRVGNKSSTAYKTTIKNLDTTAPTQIGSATLSNYNNNIHTWVNTYVDVTFVIREAVNNSFANDYSGIKSVSIMADGVQFLNWTGTNFTNLTVSSVDKDVSGARYKEYTIVFRIIKRADYAFKIIDKAGNELNSFNYAHLSSTAGSFKPNLDKDAPLVGAVGVTDSVTGQDAKIYYVNGALKFDITIRDDDSNVLAIFIVACTPGGTGTSAVDFYGSIKEYHGIDYYLTGAGRNMVVASLTDLSFANSSKEIILPNEHNYSSCHVNTYRVIVFDKANNSTDISTSDVDYGVANDNQDTTLVVRPKRDTFVPTMDLSANGIPMTAVAGKDNYYEIDWQISAVTLKLDVVFGCSGGMGKNKGELNQLEYSKNPEDGTYSIIEENFITVDKFVSGFTNSVYNVYNNTTSIELQKTKEGIYHYRYEFTNGVGVVVSSLTLVVKLDYTAPKYLHIGYGSLPDSFSNMPDGSGSSDDILATFRNNLTKAEYIDRSYVTEDTLLKTSDAIWLDQQLTSYYYVTDGVDCSGIENLTISISHNGYSADIASNSADWENSVLNYTVKKYGGVYVLVVKFNVFNDFKLLYNSAQDKYFYNDSTGFFDVKTGERVVYNILLGDSVGNDTYVKTYDGNSIGDGGISTKDLTYALDPFQNGIPKVISRETFEYSEDGLSMVNREDYDRDWTSKNIIITINKQLGISPIRIEYRFVDIINDYGSDYTLSKSDLNYKSPSEWKQVTNDYDGSVTSTLIIPTTTQRAIVEFRSVSGLRPDGNLFGIDYLNNQIRQDNVPPKLTKIVFSYDDNLTEIPYIDENTPNSSVFMSFDVDFDGTNYTFKRETSDTRQYVWTHKKLYVYTIVTDVFEGYGSGVSGVTIKQSNSDSSDVSSEFIMESANNIFSMPVAMFRSNLAENYAYDTKEDTHYLSYLLTDEQSNSITINALVDDDDYKMMPILDTKVPTLSINSAVYGINNTSYINNGTFSGDAIKSDLLISFDFFAGQSGAKLFVRKSTYGGDVAKPNVKLDGSYEFLTNGFYPDELDGMGWEFDSDLVAINEGANRKTYRISNLTQVKANYEFMIVLGTGACYYVNPGNVNVDAVPPTIVKVYQVLGNNSINDLSEMTIAVLRTASSDINATKETNGSYTNDSIYLYFEVEDTAAGIDRMVTNSVGDSTSEILLEEVSINVNGTITPFFRYKLDSSRPYSFAVYDNAGNKQTELADVTSSNRQCVFSPYIDNSDVLITITAIDDDGNPYLPEKDNYKNVEYIDIIVSIRVGLSGFNYDSLLDFEINGNDTFVKDEFRSSATEIVYSMRISSEQSNEEFRFVGKNNVKYNQNSSENIFSVVMAEKTIYISIDRSAPVLDLSINPSLLNINNFAYLANGIIWYNESQALFFMATDEFSDIKEAKLHYELDGKLESVRFIRETSSEGLKYFRAEGDFVLDDYIVYSLELVDFAGNINNSHSLQPRIDKNQPSFGETLATYIDTDANNIEKEYDPRLGVWIKHKLKIEFECNYFVSGYHLEYYTDSNAMWLDYPVDGITTTTYNGIDTISLYIDTLSYINDTYKFRLVSGSGIESDELNFGVVKIDKTAPVLSVEAKDNNNNVLSTTHNDITTVNKWSRDSIKVVISWRGTIPSGYNFQYSLSENNWITVDINNTSENTKVEVNNGVTTFTFIYKLKTDKVTYSYRVITGANIIVTHTVKDIRIDNTKPSVIISSVVADSVGINTDSNEDFIEDSALVNDYLNNESNIYDGNYTSKNFVIIELKLHEASLSGIDIYLNGAIINGSDKIYKKGTTIYILAKKTITYEFEFVSSSGISVEKEVEIKIDNSLPVVYVESIEGTRSNNWDNGIDNSWYTGEVTIVLNYGVVADIGGGKYFFTNSPILSGYTLYYYITKDEVSIEGIEELNGVEWKATEENSNTITISTREILKNRYIYFRIITGSGNTYTLGHDIVDKEGNNIVGKEELPLIPTDSADCGIDSESILDTHLANQDYIYLLNMDINKYYVHAEQIIRLRRANDTIDIVGSDYADFEAVKLINVGGSLVEERVDITDTAQTFLHGDKIKIKVKNKDYEHRYTLFGEVGVDLGSTGQGQNEFDFIFGDSDFIVKSYFKKSIEINYANTIMYLQEKFDLEAEGSINYNDLKVSAESYFNYTYQGIDDTISIPLTLTYKNIDGQIIDFEDINDIGYYTVNATVGGENLDSFSISNDTQDFIVKYFKPNAQGKFEIRDTQDLNYISRKIVDNQNNVIVDYTTEEYIQTKDITLDADFVSIDAFSGKYYGGGFAITFAGNADSNREVSENYGFFTSINGENAIVENLKVIIDGTWTIDNASCVGILAGELVSGSVSDIYVAGEYVINSTKENACIGGLFGSATDANIGRAVAGKEILVDINITNNGATLSDNTYIGGLVGNVSGNSKVYNTNIFGDIVVYNNETTILNSGAVFGDIDTTTEENFAFNSYLENTLFINGELIQMLPMSGFKNVEMEDFVEDNKSLATTQIVDETIRVLVLDRLYSDFGLYTDSLDDENNVVENSYVSGLGTEDAPLKISNNEQVMLIDKYVTLFYSLQNDLNMHNYNFSIATHKQFLGEFNGNNNKIIGFASKDDVEELDSNYYGLFANLNGVVKNLRFVDIDSVLGYNGSSDTIYAGLVAGRSYANASITNIYLLGNVEIMVENKTIRAGAVVGEMSGGSVTAVFNMINQNITGDIVYVGGLLGSVNNGILATDKQANPVYSMGRVEGNYTTKGYIGTLFGTGSLSGKSSIEDIFVLENNVYDNNVEYSKVQGDLTSSVINPTTFDNSVMRETTIITDSGDYNMFSVVFGNSLTRLYPLSGLGTQKSPFIVNNVEGYKCINDALYAKYRIESDITFNDDYVMIGEGLVFRGEISGNVGATSAEHGTIISINNMTDTFVYNNAGTISNLALNVYYDRVVRRNEEIVFGAVACYNSGTISNLIVGGEINISTDNIISEATVSGFVGVDLGGYVDNANIGYQTNISKISINVSGFNVANIGGYVGVVKGKTNIFYGFGSGEIVINNCKSYNIGTLVGRLDSEELTHNGADIEEYQYTITIDGVEIVVGDEHFIGYKVIN